MTIVGQLYVNQLMDSADRFPRLAMHGRGSAVASLSNGH